LPPATPRSSRRALRQLGSRLHWYARPCSSRDQEGANLQIRRRMRPTHFRNSLFPVLGEISQNRANDLLAERITRAAHSSGRVAGLPSGRVARRGYPPSCACPARLACNGVGVSVGVGDSVGVELLHLLLLAHPVRLADKARTPPAWGNLHHTFAAGSSSGRMCLWGSCVCAP